MRKMRIVPMNTGRWSRSRPVLVLLLVGAVVFLCAPRATGWQLLHLHKEDGVVFLSEWTRMGAGSIFHTYTGYVHFVPRILTMIAAQLPAQWFSVVVGVLCALWRVWLAILTVWALESRGVERRRAQLAGAAFVLLPVGEYEVLGNLTNLRWFCDAAAVVLALSVLRGARSYWAAATMAACALTDPLVATLSPFFLAVLAARRGRAWLVPVVGVIGGLAQVALMDVGARESYVSAWLHAPTQLAQQVLVRQVMTAQFGVVGTETLIRLLGLSLAIAVVVLPIALLATGRSRESWLLAAAGAYLLMGTIAFATPSLISVNRWWGVAQPSRYCVAPALLLTIGGVLAARTRPGALARWVSLASACVVLLAVAADAKGDRLNSDGPIWSASVRDARAVCRSGAAAARVEMTPTTVDRQWAAPITCRWLLRSG